MESKSNAQTAPADEPTRRDFLLYSTSAMAAAGAAAAAWPFIDSMNPAADTRAVAEVGVDLDPIQAGQRITVRWQGKPVFIQHRTPEEVAAAEADDDAELIDAALDRDRVKRKEWLVVIGVCTHLGCIPLGQRPTEPRGKHGGWFCPCHGSVYDTAGRVRRSPAPKNLYLPKYAFLDDATVRIG